MPYKSRAQQGYMHAAEERGEVSPKVVHEFDKATSAKQYARLPEHVGHAAKGGLLRRLAEHYFGGGRAEDAACQHYAHGGVSDRHDPGCPNHPSHYAEGGEAERRHYEPPEDYDLGEKPEHELPDYRLDVYQGENVRHEREATERREREYERDEYPKIVRRAQGGEAEETERHLEGADWQDEERNRSRSPLAERLAGARMSRAVLERLLRKPGSRVP